MNVQSSTVINRPIEEVFTIMSNLENIPEWAPGFLEVKKTSPGPIDVGTIWRVVQEGFGR